MNSKHTKGPWEISWYNCKMDKEDVEHAKSKGNANAKVGDIMWRSARSIGPVSVEHCHWAGSYLDGSEADIILMSSAPDLLLELQKCRDLLSTVETCSRNNFENLAHEQIQEMDVVIALATRGEKC